MLTRKRIWTLFLQLKSTNMCLLNRVLAFPSLDAPPEEKKQYYRWQKSNEMAKCYILASISNVL